MTSPREPLSHRLLRAESIDVKGLGIDLLNLEKGSDDLNLLCRMIVTTANWPLADRALTRLAEVKQHCQETLWAVALMDGHPVQAAAVLHLDPVDPSTQARLVSLLQAYGTEGVNYPSSWWENVVATVCFDFPGAQQALLRIGSASIISVEARLQDAALLRFPENDVRIQEILVGKLRPSCRKRNVELIRLLDQKTDGAEEVLIDIARGVNPRDGWWAHNVNCGLAAISRIIHYTSAAFSAFVELLETGHYRYWPETLKALLQWIDAGVVPGEVVAQLRERIAKLENRSDLSNSAESIEIAASH